MNVIIFDSETTSLDKPFMYNVGYTVREVGSWRKLIERDFVVEQVWENLMLFQSAYYADKRPLYVSAMRGKRATLEKFGYIMQQMKRDIKNYEVEAAFAYNSDFDERAFNFCCDWFKCINPLEALPIYDIRGYVHEFLIDDDFKAFCDKYEYYTESGNYSTTAETVYRFITCFYDFNEAHTALADSQIEAEILQCCVDNGADILGGYKAKRSIERKAEKPLCVIDMRSGEVLFNGTCEKVSINKDKTEIKIK